MEILCKMAATATENGNGCKIVRGSPTLMVHPAATDAVSLIFGFRSPPPPQQPAFDSKIVGRDRHVRFHLFLLKSAALSKSCHILTFVQFS